MWWGKQLQNQEMLVYSRLFDIWIRLCPWERYLTFLGPLFSPVKVWIILIFVWPDKTMKIMRAGTWEKYTLPHSIIMISETNCNVNGQSRPLQIHTSDCLCDSPTWWPNRCFKFNVLVIVLFTSDWFFFMVSVSCFMRAISLLKFSLSSLDILITIVLNVVVWWFVCLHFI